MKQVLKPCPFCGGTSTLVSTDPTRLACVMCETCDAWYGGCMKDKEVVLGWNTRALDARVQLLAKALLDARAELWNMYGIHTKSLMVIDAALAEAGIKV